MASKYPIMKEDQDLVSTDKHLDESGHWTVPPGGSSKLSELEDVELTDVENGQTLIYNSETQKFENGDGGSGSDPEYEYSYWREHREEIEATGKRFIVTNAPPSPDLVAENIGYDGTESGLTADNVQDAIDVIANSGGSGDISVVSDAWDPEVQYHTVDKPYCIYNNVLYRCINNNIGMQPDISSTYWAVTNVGNELKAIKSSIPSIPIDFEYICRGVKVGAYGTYDTPALSPGTYLYSAISNTVIKVYWVIINQENSYSTVVTISSNQSGVMHPSINGNKLRVTNNNAWERYFTLVRLTKDF